MENIPDTDWAEIDDLFSQYLEYPEKERHDFLCSVKERNECAYVALMDLVRQIDAANDFLNHTTEWFPYEDVPQEIKEDNLIGTRMGPYRIEEKIGSGGMGSVYRATRADGSFEKDVAIKIIQTEKDCDAFRDQLERERHLLAKLQHPNITTLIDGGITLGGQPYFVMEYIKGTRIDTYCKKHGLDVKTRLDLFRQVCNAVSFSHHNLIVHRDLKPGNILVTDSGHVKVLDFGIARFLSPQTGFQSDLTLTNQRSLTPAYASPEQIRGEPVSTATDVYSLGVVLYQLLTNRLPHPPTDSAFGQMKRIWENRDPIRPSEAVESSSKSLRRELRGDLDLIVLKALRDEPLQRYSSIDQFSADIDNYLSGYPIEARSGSKWYTLRRTLQRHKLASSFTLLLFLVLAAFLITTNQQTKHIERERQKAVRVTSFMKSLFESADPTHKLGEHITVEEVLERGAHRLDHELKDQPETKAELLTTIGNIYLNLGQSAKAEEYLLKGLQIRLNLFGNQNKYWADSANRLGLLYLYRNQYDLAEPLLQDSLQVFIQEEGPNSTQTLSALNQMGLFYRLKGDMLKAESVFRDVIQKASSGSSLRESVERNLASVCIDLRKWTESENILSGQLKRAEQDQDLLAQLSIRGDLAILYRDMGDLEKAEALGQSNLDAHETVYGFDHVKTAGAARGLALIKISMNQYERALELLERSLKIAKDNYPSNHSFTALILDSMGDVLERKGDFQGGLVFFKKALDMNRALHDSDHPDIAVNMQDVANVLQQLGEFREAESLHIEALAMSRRLLGKDHSARLVSPMSLGYMYFFSGRHKEALPLFSEAERVLGSLFGTDHARTVAARHGLAWVVFELGQVDRAEELFKNVASKRRLILGNDHPDLATTLHSLAWVEFSKKQFKSAEKNLNEALRIRRLCFGKAHPDIAWSLNNLGLVYKALGDLDLAQTTLEEAAKMRLNLLGERHGLYLQSLNNLGIIYKDLLLWDEAETVYGRLVSLSPEVFGSRSRQHAVLSYRLAAVKDRLKDRAGAEEWYLNAIDIFKKYPDSALRIDAIINCAKLWMTQNRLPDAILLLEKGLSVDPESEKPNLYRSIHILLIECLLESEQCQLAKNHMKENFNDAASTESTDKQIAELRERINEECGTL